MNVKKFKHSDRAGHCAREMHRKIREKFGEEIEKKFFRTMRCAKNRATNPNNKDYDTYKDKGWKFSGSFDFVKSELFPFVEACEKYGVETVTIDRIDGARGYEPGNIRWVTMEQNLKNKPIIRPVRCENLRTGEVTFWENALVCAKAMHIKHARIWEVCNRPDHTYNGKYGAWKFSYAEPVTTIRDECNGVGPSEILGG